jgi:hypothetical protein
MSFPNQFEDLSGGFDAYQGTGRLQGISYVPSHQGILERAAACDVLVGDIESGIDQVVEVWVRVVLGRIHL